MGDVSSSHLLYEPKKASSLQVLSSASLMDSLSDGSMLLLDERSFFVLSKGEQDKIAEGLEKKDILLLLC